MNYADIAILVILVFSIVLGIIRGFWHTFSKIVTLIVAVVLGFMFAAELAPLIFQGQTLTFINSAVSKLIIKSDIANGVITQIGNEVYVASNGDMILIENALKTMLIPSFLHPTIIASIGGLNSLDGVTLGALVSSTYTHLVTLVLTGGIIFFAGCIVMGVISALIGKAIKNGKMNRALDRTLGAILRIFTGFMFIIIILHVFGMLSGFDFMAPVIEHIEDGAISGPLFDANLLNKIFYGEGMAKIMNIFQDVIMSVTSPEEAAPAAMLILGMTI